MRHRDGSFVPCLCKATAALTSADGHHAPAAPMVGLSESAFAGTGQMPDPDDSRE